MTQGLQQLGLWFLEVHSTVPFVYSMSFRIITLGNKFHTQKKNKMSLFGSDGNGIEDE
jgi:hypothetical protein